MIDLHCHSNHSDGVEDVPTLFRMAEHAKLQHFALTDHDSIAGLDELDRLCQQSEVQFVPGIEWSTRWKKHDIHVLGLYIDYKHPSITQLIEQQQSRRLDRARIIAGILEDLGLKNCWEKTNAIAGHAQITRPHFAKVLVQEGWVRDIPSAFTQYLARGKKAYIHTEWASIPEAVKAINEANGIAVLAHPLKYKLTKTKLNALCDDFKASGGEGLEVISGVMSKNDIQFMATMAQERNMYASSGSDYHGKSLSKTEIGMQSHLPKDCQPIWLYATKDKESS